MMRKFNKTMAGVTLLEIMLVLAIAAMIIVMSVRYYQSATTSQQVNMAMMEIQAITAGGDNLAIGSSYSAVNQTSLSAAIGRNNLISPTGAAITITQGSTTTYRVTMPLGVALCTTVRTRIAAVTKYDSASCSGTGTLTYTYDATK